MHAKFLCCIQLHSLRIALTLLCMLAALETVFPAAENCVPCCCILSCCIPSCWQVRHPGVSDAIERDFQTMVWVAHAPHTKGCPPCTHRHAIAGQSHHHIKQGASTCC